MIRRFLRWLRRAPAPAPPPLPEPALYTSVIAMPGGYVIELVVASDLPAEVIRDRILATCRARGIRPASVKVEDAP